MLEEIRSGSDTRDSKLRFYFRSNVSSHSSPRSQQQQPQPQQPLSSSSDIATQAPDRLSISLFKGTRRIVIPAEHLKSVILNRNEGYVKVEGDGWATVPFPNAPLLFFQCLLLV